MHDTRTEKVLKSLDPFTTEAPKYRHIIDNCTMYAVQPNDNKIWLKSDWVLVQWASCEHPNPFETWKLPKNQAREYFDSLISENDLNVPPHLKYRT